MDPSEHALALARVRCVAPHKLAKRAGVDACGAQCQARAVRLALALTVLLSLAACEHEKAPAASEESAPARPAPRNTPEKPSTAPTNAASSPAAPAPPVQAVELPHGSLPVRGCTLAAERVLSPKAERVWLAQEGGELVVLVASDLRTLALHRGGALVSLRAVASLTLDVPLARASLTGTARGPQLAYVDDQGRVQLVHLEPERFARPRTLATGADRRFAPAVTATDTRVLVAFTRAVGEAMHTFVARVDGEAVALSDVTPEGHGAAAPTFVLGADPPALVMIDAHAGVSPLLELPFDGAGKPGEVAVRTPVSQPYTPPLLAAVQLADGSVEVAYSAVGKLAATAIGRVPLRRSAEAVALLPSRGYGELSLSAARGEARAAFAYESPRSSEPRAPRSLEVTLVDEQGAGPPLLLAGDGAEARRPSLAVHAGTLWLGYTRGGQAMLAALRCDLD
jgi:hypothetical protein